MVRDIQTDFWGDACVKKYAIQVSNGTLGVSSFPTYATSYGLEREREELDSAGRLLHIYTFELIAHQMP